MAKAAYCSQCKANVYVTDDGGCPNGHGPESLSDYYDVPDPEQPAAPEPVVESVPEPTPEPVVEPTPEPAPELIPEPPAETPPPVAPTAPLPPAGYEVAAPTTDYGAPEYEAPTPADVAVAQSKSPSTSKVLWIVGGIVLLLILCGVAACVGFGAFLSSATDEMNTVIDESVSDIEQEIDAAAEDAGAATEDQGTVTEETDDIPAEDIQTMVAHFYPGFTLEGYYMVTLAEGPEDATTYHVIAAHDTVPEFRITFFAHRSEAENPAGSDLEGQAFYDDATGAWWIHPQTLDHGLNSVFGPEPLMTASMLDQIAADFSTAHPTKLVTDVSNLTNVDLGFQGIDEGELDDWYDDSESFESTWKLDMKTTPSVWREVDYQEF